MPEPKPDRETGLYFALGQTGLEMVAPLAIGAWLDHHFGWGPWGLIIGGVFGFVGGTIHLIMLAQKIERERSKNNE
jgi:F0F1-type ATP synthase assembly protein I